MNLFELMAKLSLDSSEYEAGIDIAKKTVSGFEKAAGVAFAAAAAAFTKFATDAVQTGIEFDASMSQVAATMGTTVDQIDNLREFAQEMGAKTKFSAVQAADALNYMALAGYDAQKSMSMLPIVLNLAAAGNMDLAKASDMVTDAESALGLTTEQTNAMVDQMAKTASKSNTSVEQLGEAMLTIGGTAQFMAGGTDRLQTVLGLLADNGIKGSEAGTHLRNMILKLSKPTKEGAATIEQLGLKIFDAEGNMRDMQDIILDLGVAMQNMTQEEKVQAISNMFNARDLSAVNALLGTSKERWDELGAAISEAGGSANQMAETQLDNLNGDITIMKSALEGVKIQFSDGITPAIRDIVQRLTKALSQPKTQKFLNDVGKKLGELLKRLTDFTARKGLPFLISLFEDGGKKLKIFGGIVAVFMGTLKAISLVPTLAKIAAFLGPTGLITVGVVGLAAGLVALTMNVKDHNKELYGLTREQKELIDSSHELRQAFEDGTESYKEDAAAIDAETEKTQNLWNELKTLAGANGEVDEKNRDRASFIIGQLNEALGTEYEMNGNLITSYQEMSNEIDNLIKKKQVEALIAAGADEYSDALKSQNEALDNAAKLSNDLEVAQNKLAIARQNLTDAEHEADKLGYTGAGEINRATYLQQYVDAVNEAQNSVNELSNAYAEAEGTLQGFYKRTSDYENAQAELAKGNYEAAIGYLKDDFKNAVDYYKKKQKLTEEEKKDLQEKIRVMESHVKEYKRQYEAGMAGFTKPVLDEMQRQVDEARLIGENIGKAVADGISAKEKYMRDKASGLVRVGLNSMRSEAKIQSPSKRGRAIGENIGGSVGLGIADAYSSVIKTAEDFTDGVLSAMDDDYETQTFVTETKDTGLGRFTMANVVGLLEEIRDNLGFDVVLDDGTIVGRIDRMLGKTALRKARGGA